MATMTPETTITKDELEELFSLPAYDKGYILLALDCDCHSMDYVVAVFIKQFKFSEEKAIQKMAEVHYEGQSAVAHGTREEMEYHKEALNAYGLRAMIEQAS